MDTSIDIQELMSEQFAKLPAQVQEAITSADVQKRMRELAQNYKLHLDQWQILENQVLLTLLGFQEASELAHHIESDVGVPKETAEALAAAIAQQVFDPIRGELERILEHPEAEEKTEDAVKAMTAEFLAEARVENIPAPTQTPEPTNTPAPSTTTPEVTPTIAAPALSQVPSAAPTLPTQEVSSTTVPATTTTSVSTNATTAPASTPTPSSTVAAPTVKRGTLSGTYTPGEPSAVRKAVEGDPYREPVA